MHAFSTLFLLALPFGGFTLPLSGQTYSRLGRSVQARNNGPRDFKLVDLHEGKNFFDGWDFFTAPDPTHGNVNFLGDKDAFEKKLAFVQDDNTTVLAVDDTTHLPVGQNRNSIRITSKKSYSNGLFIADFWAMPHGCSVWPAWWSVGPNWPNNGEIDVIEGVNNQATNQMTLHTSQGCTLERQTSPNPNLKVNVATTGKILGAQCASSGNDNTGCAFSDPNPQSHGKGFNLIAGGVFAHLWDNDSIKIWHFPRGSIPADIEERNPNPSTWPTPSAVFTSASCDISKHFKDHQLVIDTTLCGDFAGSAFGGSQCPGTCAEAVANPNNFKFAKWKIRSIAVYQ